ncbi:MAG: hypothetical protein JXR95_09395 [Deltaproteobacteria bacterium]|nr:hypothetical protein [Deltaproteobacteria bacterium]
MKARKNREIMVFSISFLDVIASALGAILLLFIIQYQKTMAAQLEAVETENRHSQCTQVLQWAFDQQVTAVNNTVHPNVVQEERIVDKSVEDKSEIELAGLDFKPKRGKSKIEHPVRLLSDPEKLNKKIPMRKTKKIPEFRKIRNPEIQIPDKNPETEKKPVTTTDTTPEDSMNIVKKQPVSKEIKEKNIKHDSENKKKMIPEPVKKTVDNKNKSDSEKKKGSIPSIKSLPYKSNAATLATCVTSLSSVKVKFYDHDEPDGDTILVTFNGRNATKLKLEKTPTRIFTFNLQKNKYNIIVIKNISNGFYPINTAYVQVSGCGRARWKIKQLGASRAIYIYRK